MEQTRCGRCRRGLSNRRNRYCGLREGLADRFHGNVQTAASLPAKRATMRDKLPMLTSSENGIRNFTDAASQSQ